MVGAQPPGVLRHPVRAAAVEAGERIALVWMAALALFTLAQSLAAQEPAPPIARQQTAAERTDQTYQEIASPMLLEVSLGTTPRRRSIQELESKYLWVATETNRYVCQQVQVRAIEVRKEDDRGKDVLHLVAVLRAQESPKDVDITLSIVSDTKEIRKKFWPEFTADPVARHPRTPETDFEFTSQEFAALFGPGRAPSVRVVIKDRRVVQYVDRHPREQDEGDTVEILATLVDRLDRAANADTRVIPWACPVLSFDDLATSRVATLGLNPSNREFMDKAGNELPGVSRRFPTLKSLGLGSWSEVDSRHLRLILDSCQEYFGRNPYGWFSKLDQVIAGTNTSYFNATNRACHLDLIPYATECKWSTLSIRQRSSLLAIAGDTLGLLLHDAPVKILILNGKGVVTQFQKLTGIRLEEEQVPNWSLSTGVPGFAYRGVVDTLSGIRLAHNLLVLGFNHNIQGSPGVTGSVISSISGWIARAVSEAIP